MLLDKTRRNNDGALERSVERQIVQRTWGRIHQLQVELSGERLIVHGRAGSYYAKQLALEAALDSLGSTDATAVELDIEIGLDMSPVNRMRSPDLWAD